MDTGTVSSNLGVPAPVPYKGGIVETEYDGPIAMPGEQKTYITTDEGVYTLTTYGFGNFLHPEEQTRAYGELRDPQNNLVVTSNGYDPLVAAGNIAWAAQPPKVGDCPTTQFEVRGDQAALWPLAERIEAKLYRKVYPG